MQVKLYTVRTNEGWQMGFTLDSWVDSQYWCMVAESDIGGESSFENTYFTGSKGHSEVMSTPMIQRGAADDQTDAKKWRGAVIEQGAAKMSQAVEVEQKAQLNQVGAFAMPTHASSKESISDEGSGRCVYKMAIIHLPLPFPMALRMTQRFVSERCMDDWGEQQWKAYTARMLCSYTEWFGGEDGRTQWSLQPLRVELIQDLKKRNTIVESAHCGMRYETSNVTRSGPTRSMVAEGTARYELCNGRQTTAEWKMSERSEMRYIQEMCDRLVSLIEGRALMEAEVLSLMKAHGYEINLELLRSILQLGMLQGDVELTNGVATGERTSGWIRFSQQVKRLVGRSLPVVRLLAHGNVLQEQNVKLQVSGTEPHCRRCGSREEQLQISACASCGSAACYTCLSCLNLARSRSCSLLVLGVTKPKIREARVDVHPQRKTQELTTDDTELLLERYGLAAAQKEASRAALCYLRKRDLSTDSSKGEFLLWAVTGAGKTEMLFPMAAYAFNRGQKVCIATPRRDVVLELQPRIEKAFPGARVVTLYGGSDDRWSKGDITLATTHQLLRFYKSFDLMVVDELDAYPYHNNPMLQRAAQRACAPGGTFVYLSATPPKAMQRAVRRGRLAQAIVPVRYHRHPLPVPARMAMPGVARCIARGRLPQHVVLTLRRAVDRGAQLFVFVARIRHIDGVVELLRTSFPQQPVAGTSAADSQRTDKVRRFRQGEIRVLVTTTILERGVTVPKSDVFILDADNSLFDESSLVQMAGRAGRSKDDPYGVVCFGAPQWTRSQRDAVRQIRRMNRIARNRGYLRTSTS
ncbi:helicase-related protein [Paenibacillus sp. UMB4589-SE434]|uniref:DEAD/DEAH box helicase n=1 Tax=Paenibacillus sp. UMB4589-SE434 TaxID=3046314 RepID=UPI00254C2553|nr:helicase-related protein [Paenibacillus sp. UMB4589-SE434]MDK8181624.1 helicase-related protein [Paenibacillus sp. UMB4589-SE434]